MKTNGANFLTQNAIREMTHAGKKPEEIAEALNLDLACAESFHAHFSKEKKPAPAKK